MRTGATQESPTATPDIDITVSGDSYSSAGATPKLVRAYEHEKIWGGEYHFWIDNSDSALVAKDYVGDEVTVTHGFVGDAGSTIGVLWVDSQEFISEEGKLLLHLICMDGWGLLSRVKGGIGGSYWNYPDQHPDVLDEMVLPDGVTPLPADLKTKITAHWNKTVQTIITDTIKEALDYTNTNITVDMDNTDAYINVEKPQVASKDARSLVIQAMEVTASYLRWEDDKDFHAIEPGAQGAAVYSYNAANLLFSDIEKHKLGLPNRVVVWYIDETDADPDNWTWEDDAVATDSDSYGQLGFYIDEHHMLEKNLWESMTAATAQDRADARMAKLLLKKGTGKIVAPMHCAQELFDLISVTDDRYDTPQTFTGYVFEIVREYDRGVYQITLILGGVEGGYTPSGGEDINIIPVLPHSPGYLTSWTLPKAIQGFQHDITFTATDYNTISIGGGGTIKFYDGSTQTINYIGSSPNTSYDLPDGDVRYVYFDLDDDDPDILKVTNNYINVLTTKTGVICLIQRGVSGESPVTIIPSYGKEPLLTPDVIYMTDAATKLSTLITGGKLWLKAATVAAEGAWYSAGGVIISATTGVEIVGGTVGTQILIFSSGGVDAGIFLEFDNPDYFLNIVAPEGIRLPYGDLFPTNAGDQDCGDATDYWYRVISEFIYGSNIAIDSIGGSYGYVDFTAAQYMDLPRRSDYPTAAEGRTFIYTGGSTPVWVVRNNGVWYGVTLY